MKKTLVTFYVAALTSVLAPNVLPARPSAAVEAPKPPKPSVKPVPKPKPSLHPKVLAERASRSQWPSTREWKCLEYIWDHESHFNPKARNKRSGAYGIAQFMPQTWKNYKVKKTADAALQIKYGLRYITKRYKTPCKALRYRKTHGYY